MIWNALKPAVHRMEGMTGERGWHNPLVMRLVEGLVHSWVMQSSMNPIHQEVGEEDEKWELQYIVQSEWCFYGCVVQLGISFDFCEEKWYGQDSHYRYGLQGLMDLKAHLVLEVLWMRECSVIEDEEIG